jgi:Protein of unknown function (DUF3108)
LDRVKIKKGKIMVNFPHYISQNKFRNKFRMKINFFVMKIILLMIFGASLLIILPKIALTATPHPSAFAGAIMARYEVSLAGLTAGSLEISLRLDPQGFYHIETLGKTSGLIGVLMAITNKAVAGGKIANGKIIPETFTNDILSQEKRRSARLHYSGPDKPIFAEITPSAAEEGREPIPPLWSINAQDPLASGLYVLYHLAQGQGCGLELVSFDGRRLTRVVMKDPALKGGKTTALALPELDQAIKPITAPYACLLGTQRLAGLSRKDQALLPPLLKSKEKPKTPATIWVASLADNLPPLPIAVRRQGGISIEAKLVAYEFYPNEQARP